MGTRGSEGRLRVRVLEGKDGNQNESVAKAVWGVARISLQGT